MNPVDQKIFVCPTLTKQFEKTVEIDDSEEDVKSESENDNNVFQDDLVGIII